MPQLSIHSSDKQHFQLRTFTQDARDASISGWQGTNFPGCCQVAPQEFHFHSMSMERVLSSLARTSTYKFPV